MTEPKLATQVNERGENERVDTNIYSLKIVCEHVSCTQIRYIKPQDRTQVRHCKVHAREARLQSRAKRAREGRARKAHK